MTYITAGDAALQRARKVVSEHNDGRLRIWRATNVYRIVADDLTEDFGPGYVVQRSRPKGVARRLDFRAEGPFDKVN